MAQRVRCVYIGVTTNLYLLVHRRPSCYTTCGRLPFILEERNSTCMPLLFILYERAGVDPTVERRGVAAQDTSTRVFFPTFRRCSTDFTRYSLSFKTSPSWSLQFTMYPFSNCRFALLMRTQSSTNCVAIALYVLLHCMCYCTVCESRHRPRESRLRTYE